ncbi:hypothetical protein BOX15_Mlig001521g2, partial [Macrostomum lignano]
LPAHAMHRQRSPLARYRHLSPRFFGGYSESGVASSASRGLETLLSDNLISRDCESGLESSDSSLNESMTLSAVDRMLARRDKESILDKKKLTGIIRSLDWVDKPLNRAVYGPDFAAMAQRRNNYRFGAMGDRQRAFGTLGHRERGLGAVGHREHGLGAVGHREHGFGAVGHREHGLGAVGHREHGLGAVGHREHGLGAVGHREHGLGAVGHREHELGAVGHREHGLGAVGHREHGLGAVGHREQGLGAIGRYERAPGATRHRDRSEQEPLAMNWRNPTFEPMTSRNHRFPGLLELERLEPMTSRDRRPSDRLELERLEPMTSRDRRPSDRLELERLEPMTSRDRRPSDRLELERLEPMTSRNRRSPGLELERELGLTKRHERGQNSLLGRRGLKKRPPKSLFSVDRRNKKHAQLDRYDELKAKGAHIRALKALGRGLPAAPGRGHREQGAAGPSRARRNPRPSGQGRRGRGQQQAGPEGSGRKAAAVRDLQAKHRKDSGRRF